MESLIYFIIFAILGQWVELVWTAFYGFIEKGNIRLPGHSTIWMFPIYGGIYFIVMIVQLFYGDYPWYFRGFMYVGFISAWEYVTGYLIRKFVGKAPWNYAVRTKDGVGSPKKMHIGGLVCVEYFPVWFVGGLLAEAIYFFIKTHIIF